FIQNVFKYVNLKLLLNEKDDNHFKLVNSPLFKRNIIFDSNFEAIEMRKERVLMNMPIHIGFSILELSKLYMYQFYYDILKPHFGDKMQLLMTDTDSLLIHIKCKDIYKELKYLQNKYNCFDFSEFDKNHFMYDDKNHKEIGKMAIELANCIITEFVGLKPKMYALKCISPDNINKQSYKKVAKGIKKSNIKKELTFDTYKDVLFSQKLTFTEYKSIKSLLHEIYTQSITKIGLSPIDSKRFILNDGINSLAHGHYKIKQLLNTPEYQELIKKTNKLKNKFKLLNK